MSLSRAVADSIQSVTIFGTGLIGTSIGLALRAQGFAGSIVGWDRSASEARIARERGAIDSIAEDPLAAAERSDCIVLATPVFGILEWIDRLAPVLRRGQLVTDVGSTKQTICEHASATFSGKDAAHFLPGHPMAGTMSRRPVPWEGSPSTGRWLRCFRTGIADTSMVLRV